MWGFCSQDNRPGVAMVLEKSGLGGGCRQNKNCTLCTMLVSLVNSNDIAADEIVLRYFEAESTTMSVDSVHHGVEKQL